MKSLIHWTRRLCLVGALAAISGPVVGQQMPYTMPMEMPPEYGAGPTGYPSMECRAIRDAIAIPAAAFRVDFVLVAAECAAEPVRVWDWEKDSVADAVRWDAMGNFRRRKVCRTSLRKLFRNVLGIGPFYPNSVRRRWRREPTMVRLLGRSDRTSTGHGAGNFIFSTLGRGPVTATNVALGSDATDFDEYEVGLGLQGNIQVGPGSNVEAVYFGLNEWEESATATSTAPNLFSFFSDFGNDPFNGFDDPDRSFVHRINYKSRINNGEVNFRRRWPNPPASFKVRGGRHPLLSLE